MKEYIDFEQLLGEHTLNGVQYISGDGYSQGEKFLFELDGITYCAEEYPEDMYSSYLGFLYVTEDKPTTRVPNVKVICSIDEDAGNDELIIRDIKNDKIILSVGTEDFYDYYPYFVAV